MITMPAASLIHRLFAVVGLLVSASLCSAADSVRTGQQLLDEVNPRISNLNTLQLKEMLEKTIQFHGVPKKIFNSLISEYEKKYGYHFQNDNPYNLLKAFELNALILHDFNDQTTPFSVSQKTAELYGSIDLIKTEGLGHIRILRDQHVIEKAQDYFKNFHVNNLNSQNKLINSKDHKILTPLH